MVKRWIEPTDREAVEPSPLPRARIEAPLWRRVAAAARAFVRRWWRERCPECSAATICGDDLRRDQRDRLHGAHLNVERHQALAQREAEERLN